MQINFNTTSIFEQILSGILVFIIGTLLTWIGSLLVSKKSRYFSWLLITWIRSQWQHLIVVLFILSTTISVHAFFLDWKITIISLICVTLSWILTLLMNYRKDTKVVFYDFRKPQTNWKPSNGWQPEIDTDKGIKLEDHMNLTRYIANEDVLFFTGTIQCEILLEENAIFDLVFRGNIRHPFYMARLDARKNSGNGDIYDCILNSLKGSTGGNITWEVCSSSKGKGNSGHTSPVNEWINMKLVCTRRHVTLFVNDYQVDTMRQLRYGLKPSNIAIFVEIANVYIRKLQITQIP